MKRDMDMIRDLLLRIEGGEKAFTVLSADAAVHLGVDPEAEGALPREEAEKLEGHIDLFEDAGFIEIFSRGGGTHILVDDLTWAGHDFIDSVRSDSVWNKTKEGASKAGGWTAGFLLEIAKGVIKSELTKHGIPLS